MNTRQQLILIFLIHLFLVWLGGIVLGVGLAINGFDSQPPHFWVQHWASCSHMCPSPSSINLVPAQSGKVTTGLALPSLASKTIVAFPTTGSRPLKGRSYEHTACVQLEQVTLSLPLLIPTYPYFPLTYSHESFSVPKTSIVMQHFIQSASTLCMT